MTHNPTVFIVDDDQEVRDAIKLLMDSVDLAAETFESAQDYLERFDPQLTNPLLWAPDWRRCHKRPDATGRVACRGGVRAAHGLHRAAERSLVRHTQCAAEARPCGL